MAQLVVRDLWRIPGLLSLSRIPLAALFILLTANPPAAIAVLFLAALTDVADGWFARRAWWQLVGACTIAGVRSGQPPAFFYSVFGRLSSSVYFTLRRASGGNRRRPEKLHQSARKNATIRLLHRYPAEI